MVKKRNSLEEGAQEAEVLDREIERIENGLDSYYAAMVERVSESDMRSDFRTGCKIFRRSSESPFPELSAAARLLLELNGNGVIQNPAVDTQELFAYLDRLQVDAVELLLKAKEIAFLLKQ